MMSDSESVAHNTKLLRELEVGDTIEVPRGFYSHWAVYIGDGQVVHIAEGDKNGINGNFDLGHLIEICGQKFYKAFVKVDHVWDVIQGSKAKVNINKDRKMRPLPKEEIVQRAMFKIGEIGYSVMWYNCEHFASWCRYGKAMSDQVEMALAMAAFGGPAFALLGIAICGTLSTRSQESDEKESEH